jgi:hypothetical protein
MWQLPKKVSLPSGQRRYWVSTSGSLNGFAQASYKRKHKLIPVDSPHGGFADGMCSKKKHMSLADPGHVQTLN